jgi:predicted 3-demethylubiquinone-9 3-methyltransferase (glyoxalase superfamily)
MQNVSTCLWFDRNALEAAEFYVGIFPNSAILEKNHYLDHAPLPAGTVLTVRFRLDGCDYVALNGGPVFRFSPAISLVAYCEGQEEYDRLWHRLGEGGQHGQCGWLTDKFGVSWQVVPRELLTCIASSDRAAAQRAFDAMMGMGRIDIETVRQAFVGKTV